MGRSPCCDREANVKKGPWTTEEDTKLMEYIQKHGCGNWRNLPKNAGLNRCGKSCRLRWTNYLRPDIKRGRFTEDEEQLIIQLHSVLGNKWSMIAARLPGRTDNEIKNYWNTHLRKKLLIMGIDPVTHRPRSDHLNLLSDLQNYTNLATNPLINNAIQLQKLQLFQTLIQVIANNSANAKSLMTSNNMFSNVANDFVPSMNYGDHTLDFDSVPSMTAEVSENGLIDQVQLDAFNLSASSSPNSAPLEINGGLTLDDVDIDDFGWKDILDHISWSG